MFRNVTLQARTMRALRNRCQIGTNESKGLIRGNDDNDFFNRLNVLRGAGCLSQMRFPLQFLVQLVLVPILHSCMASR